MLLLGGDPTGAVGRTPVTVSPGISYPLLPASVVAPAIDPAQGGGGGVPMPKGSLRVIDADTFHGEWHCEINLSRFLRPGRA